MKALAVVALALALTGCPQGSTVHKVTVAQHNFRFAVQAFQDAEIAEHDHQFVPDDLHLKMQLTIGKVALAGKDLDTALAAGASAADLKAKLDAIYALLDSLNADGISGIKNATSKAALEVALDSIKAIIDTALTQIAEMERNDAHHYNHS